MIRKQSLLHTVAVMALSTACVAISSSAQASGLLGGGGMHAGGLGGGLGGMGSGSASHGGLVGNVAGNATDRKSVV